MIWFSIFRADFLIVHIWLNCQILFLITYLLDLTGQNKMWASVILVVPNMCLAQISDFKTSTLQRKLFWFQSDCNPLSHDSLWLSHQIANYQEWDLRFNEKSRTLLEIMIFWHFSFAAGGVWELPLLEKSFWYFKCLTQQPKRVDPKKQWEILKLMSGN